jgi:hypothetical protein
MEEVVRESREERRRRWLEHVEGQRRSGLKVAAYCEANGLNAGQFWYWRRALRSVCDGSGGFVELTKNGDGECRMVLVVRGVTIQVRDGFSPSLLRQVLSCLGVP